MRRPHHPPLRLWSSLLLLGIGPVPLTAQCADPTTADAAADPGAALGGYLERVAPFGFSGAVLVARGDDVVLHAGYGLADRENRVTVAPETVFDIGSITKQFTAAAILKLEEQGRLGTDDPIARFFPDVPVDKRAITIHHLLTHTSGLPGDLGGDYDVMPRDTVVARALAAELESEPGERFDYSNLGYSLLGAIVELTSGQGYEEFLRDRLLLPAGLRRTGYSLVEWAPGELAVGYRGTRRWGTPVDHAWAPDGPWWNLRANGGILSTVGDLLRWHRALETDAVLSAASRRKLQAPYVSEGFGDESHYAYGWAVFTTERDTRLVAHNGGNGYFFADFLRYVDEDVVVVLATNRADGPVMTVRDRVLGAVFGGESPVLPPEPGRELAAGEAERYAGAYRLPSGAKLVVAVHDGLLAVDADGQAAADLLAGTRPENRASYAALTARADAVLAAFAAGDLEPLREASEDFERRRTVLERIWRTAEGNLGGFVGHRVPGTVAAWWSGEPEPVTFVVLEFERGTRLFRLHWADERIVGFGGTAIPNPARTTLLPLAEPHRFVGYNLGIEQRVPLRFVVAADGTVEALVLETADGELTAQRRSD